MKTKFRLDLDCRLRYYQNQCNVRIMKIVGHLAGTSFYPIPQRVLLTDEKAHELFSRYQKNKKWADYLLNKRYELAGL